MSFYLLLAATILFFAFTRTEAGRAELLRQAEQQFASRFDGSLEIGSIHGNVVYSLLARDVVIKAPNGSVVASIDSIRARPTWSGLLRNTLDFDHLDIVGADVFLERGPSGAWNIQEALTPRRYSRDSTAIVPSVILPRLAISRATINIANDAEEHEETDGYFFDYLNSTYSIRDALVAADWSEGSLQVDVIRFAGAVLDPTKILADLPVTDATGQLIFDKQGVRLNELRVETGQSELQVVGTIDFDPVVRTLRRSQIGVRITADRVHPTDLSRLFPRQPLRVPTSVRLHATGSPTNFVVHEAAVEYGRSRLVMSGTVSTSASADSVTFDVGLSTPYLSLADLQTAVPGPLADRLAPLDTVSGDIWAQGDFPLGGSTLESFDADVQTELQSGAGGVSASGWIQRRRSDASYQLNLSIADVDAGRITGGALRSSQLTGSMFVASSSVDAAKASGLLQLELYDSVYGTVSIDSLSANVRATEGRYDGTARLFQAGDELAGALTSDFNFGLTEGQRFLNVDMVASELDVGAFVRGDALQTQVDGRAEVHLTGRAVAPAGTAVVEVNGGVVRQGDFEVELAASRSELVLANAGEGFRSELKGDLVNASLESTIPLKALIEAIPHWSRHVIASLEQLGPRPYPLEELVATPPALALTEDPEAHVRTTVGVASDSILVSLLLRRHVRMREFSGTMDLVSDSTGLSTSVELDGLSVATGPYELTRPTATMSLYVPGAGDPAEVQAEANVIAASAAKGRSRTLNPEVDVTLSQGVVKGFVGADEGGALGPVDVALTATFGGGIWNASFDRLRFEGAGYDVTTAGRHTIRLYRNAVSTRGFALVSPASDGGVQRLTVRGTYSGRDVDTLSVDASSIDLHSLSSLLDFSTRLSGSVDGTVDIARSAKSPIIAGNGTVSGLGLDQRVLGDLRVESQFLGSRDEVAVSAHLSPLSAANSNNVVENDISLEGGIRFGGTSSGRAEMDLRADIRRADLFFFEYIFPHTIDGVVGQVRGTGRIRGTLARPLFDAQLDLADARFTVPEFNLAFTAEGKVVVDRDAIQIVSATIGDPGGGSATLSGDIEFNEYRFFSLNLAGNLDRLQIMNIAHSRELPFYGNIRASGHVTLDGPISGATLRATNAQTTPASEVYIPIVEPVDVSDQSFIVFADSTGRLGDATRDQRANVLDRRPPGERSFLDGLALDLNIFAPPGSTVNLVIDPLLGDVINAVGSGRVQIRREEGVFSTFGSLEVNSGDYLFTAGDVFVRRFLIDNGGTITWDGDPTNAILDIPASYKTRASRAGLPGSEGTGSTIPLIVRLRITGRVATPQVDLSLEVDRTNRDVSGNYAALEAILNQPSRSTEYATSVLVTNSFLLTTSEANADVLASSAFNSVSHLVASHINRYLNEALPNVDFSFGVQGESAQELGVTYGIALRLLDERLVIRGQGVYQGHDDASATGSQQNLEGEFVVEVRLNPTVSVEVFYRREGDVLTSSSTLTGSTGAGVTYRTEFSTWRLFFSRIFGTRDS